MKKLDKYILSQCIIVFLISIFASACLYIIVDIFERLKNFIHYGENFSFESTLIMIGIYYLSLLPTLIFMYLPYMATLASISTILILNRSNEIIAIKTFGISAKRILLPYILLGIILGIITLISREEIIPILSRYHLTIKNAIFNFDNMWCRSERDIIIREDITYSDLSQERIWNGININLGEEGLQLVSIDIFDPQNYTICGIYITRINRKGEIVAQAYFGSGLWVKNRWVLRNGWIDIYKKGMDRIARLDLNQGLAIYEQGKRESFRKKEIYLKCTVNSDDLLMSKLTPQTMSYRSLKKHPDQIEANIEIAYRFVSPLLTLFLVIIGAGVSIRFNIRNIFLAIVTFIGIIIIYQILDTACKEAAFMFYHLISPYMIVIIEAAIIGSISLLSVKLANQ